MQSFWKKLSGLQSHVKRVGYMPCTNSINYFNDFHGLPTSELTTCGSGKFSLFIRHLTNSRNSNEPGSHGLFKPLAWTNSPIRNMTTNLHSGKPSDNDDKLADAASLKPIKFKRLDKTARHIMSILDKEEVEKVKSNREIPDIKPGYIVQLKIEVPENKSRVSVLKGIVIARRNAGLHSTFRLRRMVAGVGVESVFPLFSPNIKEMKVIDKKEVRRAKLYYLRDRMNSLKKHK